MSILIRVFFSLKLTLLSCCSSLAPSFARMSACSFPDNPQWAGIHCRAAPLVAVGFWPGLGACGFDKPAGWRGHQRGRQPACSHDLEPALWRQLHEGFCSYLKLCLSSLVVSFLYYFFIYFFLTDIALRFHLVNDSLVVWHILF